MRDLLLTGAWAAGGVLAGLVIGAWRLRAAHGGFGKALAAVLGGGGPGEEVRPK